MNMDEVVVFHHGAFVSKNKDSQKTVYTVTGTLPGYFLNTGSYRFNLIFGENQRFALYSMRDIVQFEVLNESLGSNSSILPGVVRPDIQYLINQKSLT